MAGNTAEAKELVKEGEKALNKKNMFFKKSPDWEKAADCFQKAAMIFRTPAVKQLPEAVAAFEKAAEAHSKNQAHFYAATAMENAGNILRDMKAMAAAGQHYEKASQYCLDGGKSDKAAELILKAARMMAEEDVGAAIKHYKRAIELYTEDEQAIFIGDSWRQCLALMLKHDLKDDAVAFLNSMFPTFEMLDQGEYLRKAQLAVVVIHLAKGDSVAAASARDSFGDFMMSNEGEAACDLIDAFEEGSDDKIKELVSTQTFTLLENQVARLASKLPAICVECASDMTGARSNSRKTAPAPAPAATQDGGAAAEAPAAAAAGAGGGAAAAAAAAAEDDDDMDDLL